MLDRRLTNADALILRTQALRAWLQLAYNCDCDCDGNVICELFVDPMRQPPAAATRLVRQ